MSIAWNRVERENHADQTIVKDQGNSLVDDLTVMRMSMRMIGL